MGQLHVNKIVDWWCHWACLLDFGLASVDKIGKVVVSLGLLCWSWDDSCVKTGL